MRLILVRHGETAHNADGFVQGRADVPLNELGRRQAAALAECLRPHTPEVVVSSPLERARDTAEVIAAIHGLSVTIEPDLAEMDVGEMEGLSGPQMRERFPEFLARWAGPEGPATRMPGGESLEDVQARAWSVVERLGERYPEATVVAATHNFVIATLVCRAIGLPLAGFRRFRHGVASRTVIDIRPERVIVNALNDTCHLDTAGLRSAGPWEVR
jgi:probable phosphoglycerate mutase